MEPKKTKDELKFWKTLTAILAVLLVISIFTNGFNISTSDDVVPTDTDEEGQTLAQCLTEKGAVMYGTEWCSHCNNQKRAFGDDFKDIKFVDCDQDTLACREAGIRGYPTWVINNQKYPGEQSLNKLKSLAGC
jgi:glutaredoxin